MRFPKFIFFLPIISLLISCSTNDNENTLFKLLPSDQTGISFNNVVNFTDEFNVFNYRNFYNGGGVAIGDINNDGLADIFFTANQLENRLYLNKGNLKFLDITEKAGMKGIHKWHTGATMVDINADGWLDIYVCNSGDLEGDDKANELYINQKNNTFKEMAAEYGLDDKGLSTHAAFFDYDKDGDLDCYVLNNSYRPVESFGFSVKLRYKRDALGGHRLYRNDNNKFVDVSEKAGIFGSAIGFGLGLTVGDVNNDAWEDIYVSNDFFEKDYLYINQKDGTFKESISEQIEHISQASMGSDMVDINNDGLLDIFTTDMLPEGDYKLKTTTVFDDYNLYNAKLRSDFHHQFGANCLQLNNGDGTFSEIAAFSGVNATDWSWGALAFDFNNDGWKDIFVSNGISKDLTDQDFLNYFTSSKLMDNARMGMVNFKEMLDNMKSNPIANYGYLNNKNLTFKNATAQLGLETLSFSNGASYGDLDNDGDLDLVVNNENQEAFVYQNMSSEQLKSNFIKIKLVGNKPNTFGFGAKVILYTKGQAQTQIQMPSRGFQSSVDPILNFGIANNKEIDSVKIIWPNLKMQTLSKINKNKLIVVHQNNANQTYYPPINSKKTLFKEANTIKGNINHVEDNFIDFNIEKLIPKMLSSEGPKMAIADVNGDGFQDVYVCGSKDDYGKLYIANKQNEFIENKQKSINSINSSDNTDAVFFDADNDGDSDLLVVYGGNEIKLGSIFLIPKLFLNDGKGNFSRSAQLPYSNISASCIAPHDFDNDGDVDIFIGARSIPGVYGLSPKSIILENLGKGVFTDASADFKNQLSSLGMVTDACWVDLNNDKMKDLVVVGDWMPVTIIKGIKKSLGESVTIPLSNGWWNCVTAADINSDGKQDLIGGNLGLNSKIKASEMQPANLYVNDFDQNGQTEPIAVYYKSDGKAYPFNLRGDLVAQIPSLKKKFLRYDSYAGKSIEEVFTDDQLKSSKKLSVYETRTCMFLNNGSFNFEKVALPDRAQFSSVFSILAADLNKDNKQDLFLAGNFFGLKPEVGRYDASYGVTLLAHKNGSFRYLNNSESGLFIKGEVRDIKLIEQNKAQTIIISRNNDSLKIFKN